MSDNKMLNDIYSVVKGWKSYYAEFQMKIDPGWMERIEGMTPGPMGFVIDDVDYLGIPELSKEQERAVTIQMNRGSCGVSSVAIGAILEHMGYPVTYYDNDSHAWLVVDNKYKVDTVHVVETNAQNWAEIDNEEVPYFHTKETQLENWMANDIYGLIQINGFVERFLQNQPDVHVVLNGVSIRFGSMSHLDLGYIERLLETKTAIANKEQ